MSDKFTIAVENLIKRAPENWLTSACETLRSVPSSVHAEAVLMLIPITNNADLSFLMTSVINLASGKMSWEALSWTLDTTYKYNRCWVEENHIELLWAGPAPANQIPARRIDQTLYDLIANAKHEILLVTFAAAKIERLTDELLKAANRGVKIRMILEFEEHSEGQLSFDAMKAFPKTLLAASDVYYWPVEKRVRNHAGRPGKLHAKMAIVDDTVLVASANLTDDAFNRNLEVGVVVKNKEFLATALSYLDFLISDGTLKLIQQL